MKKIAIIGAGITGLTAAFELKQRGFECTVFEATDRAGGCIKTIKSNGYMVESGPNSILDTHPDIGTLIQRLELNNQKLPTLPAAKKRFIVRNGKPIALPSSPPAFLASKAFSLRAKLRLMKEPFISSLSNEQESLADFVVRRLGQEFLDYAINPFVSGIYAGDPAKLSTCVAFPKLYELEQKYGSLIKGAIKGAKERKKRAETASKDARMFSFDEGMEVLPKQLVKKLGDSVRLHAPVIGLYQQLDSGNWLVNDEEFSDVIMAIPAHAQSQLITPFDLSFMDSIYYPAVTSLSLGFNSNQFKHALDGFGMLIPKIENRFALGSLFPSSIFPNRAPDGMSLLTVYIGGSQSPERALLNEDELINHTLNDLKELLGLHGDPSFKSMSVWPKAIPQYNLGYGKILDQMKQIEQEFTGIHFAGHYRDGISVGNSILSGINIANKISNDP